ncbi:MAG TPA: TIR domain-containing protein [Terriglobia bacterium]|nr:TIR domain-containing protein [Terriglobia bacterium]
MNNRDLHQALKTEIVEKGSAEGVNLVLVKHQWGKNDIGFSLHVEPTSYSSSGIQMTDFLAHLGFERSHCTFSGTHECYARWVADVFTLAPFVDSFKKAFDAFRRAERHLESCGFRIEQLEGWGYFMGKQSRAGSRTRDTYGDGHTAATTKIMKSAEDEAFTFVFTWIETNDGEKGWTTHYNPKNPPLSAELIGVFEFLQLQQFEDCPAFDFEPCHWRFTAYQSRGNSVFDGNAEYAHALFNAHAANFSPGIKNLLDAHRLVEPFGMKLLAFREPAERREEDIQRHIAKPAKAKVATRERGRDFDVAISFAGTERGYAEEVARRVDAAGFRVFYDDFYSAELWGKDLIEFFDDIYRKRSRYCLMFISKEYAERMWTTHERKSAQARALEEKGKEYILPIKVDDTELPGMLPTVGYLSLVECGVEKIADLLIKKLQS